MNLRRLGCCRALPFALLLLCMAHFSYTHAMIPSLTLRNNRLANTYTYTMYHGAAVTGETFVTGSTTYPYVFDSKMNAFVVSLLEGYLEFNNKSVDDVGGSLSTCMGSDAQDSTGKTCYKALLAATAPADCPAANVLCCPLFWRTHGKNVETTMAETDVETIFWNGAYAVNGFFANFSDAYLTSHGNCSRPLFDDTTEISLAVDVTGEWRFVPLTTTYVLQETAQNLTAEQAAKYFGSDPQSLINATRTAQSPFYKVIDKSYIPVAVCAGLLFIVWLFLLLACTCNTSRAAKCVRRTQARLLELKAAPKSKDCIALLNEISPDSSSEESRRSRHVSVSRQSVSRHSRRGSVSSDSASSDSSVSLSLHDDDEEEEQVSMMLPASRRQSGKSKGSTKSMKSKASTKSLKPEPSTKSLKSKNYVVSRRASKEKLEELNFPPRPDPLPGIRNRRNSESQDNGGATHQQAPAATSSSSSSAQRTKRPGSTATVVHQVNPRQNPGPNQNGWFA